MRKITNQTANVVLFGRRFFCLKKVAKNANNFVDKFSNSGIMMAKSKKMVLSASKRSDVFGRLFYRIFAQRLGKRFSEKKRKISLEEEKMAKSIYSLLLNDDVIAAVDATAVKKNMSRSAMIDTILSEYVGLQTGDRRIRGIWQEMENMLSRTHTMHFVNNAQLNLAQIITTLPFKYSPKIRYQLELSCSNSGICAISLNTRTQNKLLSVAFDNFYQRLATLEKQYLNNVTARYGNGKYVSVLRVSGNDLTRTACDILEYVVTLDGMLRAWIGGDENTVAMLFAEYAEKHICNRLGNDNSYLLD